MSSATAPARPRSSGSGGGTKGSASSARTAGTNCAPPCRPGSRLPLPAGSSGRLLAADDEVLAELASAGWIESVGSRTPGLGSISAPVQTEEGIIAAVCLAMPLARVTGSPGQDHGAVVVQAARRIEEAVREGG